MARIVSSQTRAIAEALRWAASTGAIDGRRDVRGILDAVEVCGCGWLHATDRGDRMGGGLAPLGTDGTPLMAAAMCGARWTPWKWVVLKGGQGALNLGGTSCSKGT